MYLKKVELIGFKSFASKITFDLSEGITGFVGPNGCGKSNVVDAVKWGLGEQRVSTLRGDSMQDVIFKGSSGRPPMNFAEVSLYFSNTCGTLPIDYEEVVITRRLYRSGESEYLLNRNGCRLKDIRNLLMDTGVGVNAYSMMEQGRIDSVLQTDPVSRRAIFEEAAGISRFKTRRREAERKLERTQANLLRVGDIIEELERRIRSLKNQAGRARSYLKNSERLKELKMDHFLHLFRFLEGESRDLAQRKAEGESALERLSHDLSMERDNLSEQEHDVELMGQEFSSRKTRLAEIKISIEETQGKTGYFEKRIGELENEYHELDDREGEFKTALEEKENSFKEIQQAWDDLGREEEEIAREESRWAEASQRSEAELGEARRLLESRESESIDLTSREVDLKNRAVEAEARWNSAQSGLARLAKRQDTLASDLYTVGLEMKGIAAEREVEEEARARLDGALKEGQDQARSLEEGNRVLEGELKGIESEIIKRESRIEILRTLIETREGVGKGVKAVLMEAGRESTPFPFVKGMMAELLDVDVEHSSALEAALGEVAEAVVVDNLDQARAVMNYIDEETRGRVTILPLSEFDDYAPAPASGNGTLLNHVVCRTPGLEKAVQALLGNVHIVREEELINGSRDASFHYVTLKGDRVDSQGILSVGRSSSDPGVISRRSELGALAMDRDVLHDEHEVVAERRSTGLQAFEELARKNQSLVETIDRHNKALSHLNMEHEKQSERWIQLRREYNLNALDAFELERNLCTLKSRLQDYELEREEIQERLIEARETIRNTRELVDQRREAREEIEENQRNLKFKQIQFRERREGIEKERLMFERSLEETRARLRDLDRDRERLVHMKKDLEEQLEALKVRTTEFVEKRSELSASLTEMETLLDEKRLVFASSKELLIEKEGQFEESRAQVENLRVEERGNQVRRENLVEKASDELRLDLEEAFAEGPEETDPERDWAEVEQEIDTIRDRLARMGNVNLEAINELEEVEQRYSSLILQREDLLKSIKQLEELILNLNRDSREKFQATFETVRSHFNEIFRRLFQGGKADLRLREGEDVLEAGIEVIAGPPGKEVRSINLLSGGEKTLTAVGLLFALFKSRPSPFCILDEVDAALDEINIERFCNILGSFANDSQFIIVTHSKRTMSYCDYLYGITMQENGVSTRISLNLEDYDKDKVA